MQHVLNRMGYEGRKMYLLRMPNSKDVWWSKPTCGREFLEPLASGLFKALLDAELKGVDSVAPRRTSYLIREVGHTVLDS
jgi:hypothetical protein